MMSSPRVLMFLAATPFEADWASAADLFAEVVTLKPVKRLVGRTIIAGLLAEELGQDRPSYLFKMSRLHSVKPGRIFHHLGDERDLTRLRRAIKTLNTRHGALDLLHSHFHSKARLLPRVSQRLGIPYVHTEHATSLTGTSPLGKKQLSKPALRRVGRLFAGARLVIPVSNYLRGRLEDQGLKARYRVIGNPIDTTMFYPEERIGDVATTGPLKLVTVGRLEADKGVDDLLRGVAETPHAKLRIVGAGPDQQALEALADELGLGARVVFTGRLSRPEVASELRNADVFVTATRVETFGVAVAEALACGTPVVAPSRCSMPELVTEGCGYLYDPDRAGDLGRTLRNIAAGARTHSPQHIARSVHQRFSRAAIGQALSEAYELALTK